MSKKDKTIHDGKGCYNCRLCMSYTEDCECYPYCNTIHDIYECVCDGPVSGEKFAPPVDDYWGYGCEHWCPDDNYEV
jgi:hypothetical protein